MDPPPPRKRAGADPNPGWTAAPWAGVPHPNLTASSGTAARATATPPPLPSRSGASETTDAGDRATDGASTSASRAVAAALEPVAWHAYFDEKTDVSVAVDAFETDVFRVYARRGGERNPSRGETFARPTKEKAPAKKQKAPTTVALFAHGCAYTALSWATTIEHLATRLDESVLLVAFDARDHGESTTTKRASEAEAKNARKPPTTPLPNVSADRMASDVVAVARAAIRRFRVPASSSHDAPSETDGGLEAHAPTPVKLFLVGHSMGGAAAARAAAKLGEENADRSVRAREFDLRGLVLVDVATTSFGGKGSATPSDASLRAATEAFLAKRPSSFATPNDAVAWFVRSGCTTNLESARVSAPSQLRREEKGSDAAREGNEKSESQWTWILDARATAPHWRGWFEGLSRTFLRAKCAKLLVLAGADRLDAELQIAQMQGRFQTVVVPGAGHAVHEDEPRKTADAVAGFLVRYGGTPRRDGYGFEGT